ncbi:MAG: hypothetical protein LBU58_11860 [Clostridiales bacterium]|jgi:plasmid stabilization system protein ParE|nr:hypothetical protein [Clostridiales bacterium]
MDKTYRLRYLPLFEQEMSDIADYISVHLQNPQAALRLIDDVDAAIHRNTPPHYRAAAVCAVPL